MVMEGAAFGRVLALSRQLCCHIADEIPDPPRDCPVAAKDGPFRWISPLPADCLEASRAGRVQGADRLLAMLEQFPPDSTFRERARELLEVHVQSILHPLRPLKGESMKSPLHPLRSPLTGPF